MDRSPNFGHGSRTSRRTTARASQIVRNRLFPLSSPKPEDENGSDALSRQEDSHAEDTPGGEAESVATASKTQATDLNRAAHVALLAEEDYDCFQAASDPSRAMILSELMEEVRRLPDREQRILSRRLEGWEPEQIAQEEKITRNHVNVIHCLVVKKLRAIFGEAP